MALNAAAQRAAEYETARASALRKASELVAELGLPVPARFTVIDHQALAAWSEQWPFPRPTGAPPGWNWAEERAAMQNTISRFEVALWSDRTLCGLAIGKPSSGDSHLAVRLIEGNPDPAHPLKGQVLRPLLIAAEVYALALQKRELHVDKPLPAVVPLYAALGFEIAREGKPYPYCRLKV